jgi:crossover junction endodeoxyribonuclease RuvC
MRITGLDFSLTKSGLARVEPGCVPVSATVEPAKKLGTDHRRLRYDYDQIRRFAHESDVIVIEGPAFDRFNGQHKLGGGWWIVAHVLWLDNPDALFVVIPPKSLKLYATGKGTASKDEVGMAMVRAYPESTVSNNDEADALALAVMAADQLGWPLKPVTKEQRKALNFWPEWIQDWKT